MRRNKPNNTGASGGDWSDTGTFVRKPATGWLHKESDLANGAYVKYKLSYLGCASVLESMRSLQYQTRTSVTRECIMRLAEHSGRIPVYKRRKTPKQVTRLIGDTNASWANDVNLCIDVEQLQICSFATSREITTHNLTTISFASGGDGATQDFIGYVAKDSINDRACHVFHCIGGTAQLVLASLGQAFELRYKMYLGNTHNSPQQASTPPVVPPSQPKRSYSTSRPLPEPRFLPEPRPLPEPRGQNSISYNRSISGKDPPPYTSEYNEPLPPTPPTNSYLSNQGKKRLPSEPPPMTEVTRQILAPLPAPPLIPPTRPRVYSNLPGFPEPEAEFNQLQEPQYEMTNSMTTIDRHNSQVIDAQHQRSLSRPLSYNPYDTMKEGCTLLAESTTQIVGSNVNNSYQDDKDRDYDDVEADEEVTYDVVEGYEDKSGNQIDGPIPTEPDYQFLDQPAEEEYQLITIHQKPSIDIEDQIDLTPVQTPDINHVYSNLQDELASSPNQQIHADYDDPESLEIPMVIQPTKIGEYDDPAPFLQASLSFDDNAEILPPPYSGLEPKLSPAFDDSIYSTPQLDFIEPEVECNAPLQIQSYFHGCITRTDAECLVRDDGDFLVRESSNKPGQYVLTGLSNGRAQHLLLIDKSGKVKSRDREFESVPHLVKFFYERATSLTIGNCEVFLTNPIYVRH